MTATSTLSSSLIYELVHHGSGSKASVHLYGATIISYVCGNREHLFVSKLAILDGTKPIRGGIPLVFPIFGPPPSKDDTMPQHGFARRSMWNVVSSTSSSSSSSDDYEMMVLELLVNRDTISSDGIGMNNIWSTLIMNHEATTTCCTLRYKIHLYADRLVTTLYVHNQCDVTLPYQALFHTYYRCDTDAMDPTTCYVKGLHNYECIEDKVSPFTYQNTIQNDEMEFVTIASKEVDRVYGRTDHVTDHPLQFTIGVGNDITVPMKTVGGMMETSSLSSDDDVAPTLPVSCVIWNPYIEKAKGMNDYDNDEYHDMICVEPGILFHNNSHDKTAMVSLLPGHTGILQQTIYSSSSTMATHKRKHE